MDFLKSIAIAASGLRAQAGRMQVISENITNADSTPSQPGGDPYRRKIATFQSEMDKTIDARVVALGPVRTDSSDFEVKYEPGHPAADANGNVYLWNASTGTAIATLRGPKGAVNQTVAFSPHGGLVAAASDNDPSHTYATCVWSLAGKPLATFQDPASEGVTRIAFSPDGSMLAVGDENAHAYIWNTTDLSS